MTDSDSPRSPRPDWPIWCTLLAAAPGTGAAALIADALGIARSAPLLLTGGLLLAIAGAFVVGAVRTLIKRGPAESSAEQALAPASA